MLFWSISLILAAITTVFLALPLWRGLWGSGEGRTDVAIYRDQLAEVARDLERGVLSEDEAERTRTEVARRILAADKAGSSASTTGPERTSRILAVVVVLVVGLGSVALYFSLGVPGYPDLPLAQRLAGAEEMRANRPSQLEGEEAAALLPKPDVGATEDYIAMVDQLRAIVMARPDDQQGWELLARHEASLANYAAAARAQSHLIELRGADTTTEDLVNLADMMVAATAGAVSPEAESVLREVLRRDPENLAALYYLGLLYAQTDRPDVAFRLWRVVVESGQTDAIHVQLARGQIEEAAFRAGIDDYALPTERGPNAAQMADAANMSEEDRTAMIEGMVAQLSARLASDGGTSDEWARLINAYGVLGQTERARAIYQEAELVFAGSTGDLAKIREAGAAAGVAE
jgi:cytochrome c-type biogenesis protein CcmH